MKILLCPVLSLLLNWNKYKINFLGTFRIKLWKSIRKSVLDTKRYTVSISTGCFLSAFKNLFRKSLIVFKNLLVEKILEILYVFPVWFNCMSLFISFSFMLYIWICFPLLYRIQKMFIPHLQLKKNLQKREKQLKKVLMIGNIYLFWVSEIGKKFIKLIYWLISNLAGQD